MRVRAIHAFAAFERDAARVPAKVVRAIPAVVVKNTDAGRREARRLARAASGPHGLFYYKRITSEIVSPFVGEYGPHGDVVGNAVGGGWRNGPPNMDLPKSADLIGPKFASDAGKILDDLY